MALEILAGQRLHSITPLTEKKTYSCFCKCKYRDLKKKVCIYYKYIYIYIYLFNIPSHLQTTTTNHHPTKKAISTSPPNCEGFQLNSCRRLDDCWVQAGDLWNLLHAVLGSLQPSCNISHLFSHRTDVALQNPKVSFFFVSVIFSGVRKSQPLPSKKKTLP